MFLHQFVCWFVCVLAKLLNKHPIEGRSPNRAKFRVALRVAWAEIQNSAS